MVSLTPVFFAAIPSRKEGISYETLTSEFYSYSGDLDELQNDTNDQGNSVGVQVK